MGLVGPADQTQLSRYFYGLNVMSPIPVLVHYDAYTEQTFKKNQEVIFAVGNKLYGIVQSTSMIAAYARELKSSLEKLMLEGQDVLKSGDAVFAISATIYELSEALQVLDVFKQATLDMKTKALMLMTNQNEQMSPTRKLSTDGYHGCITGFKIKTDRLKTDALGMLPVYQKNVEETVLKVNRIGQRMGRPTVQKIDFGINISVSLPE